MIHRIILWAAALACALAAQAARVDTLALATTLVPDAPVKAVVVTPDAAVAGAALPTVYILHGYGGDYKSWLEITQPKLPELADKYGMVMVFPDGRNSWYWDSPEVPEMKMESFIINELVPYVNAHYPVADDPAKRAITGLSMGGHGALWLAMRHPDVFGQAASMSGGVDIRPFPKSWKMATWLGSKDENPEAWDSHTVMELVPTLQPGTLRIAFECGNSDFFAEVNRNLHKALLDAGIPHDYTERPGAHTHDYWRNAILYHLLFFNEGFNK